MKDIESNNRSHTDPHFYVVDTYGIYADGYWTAINVEDNYIQVSSTYGTATGIQSVSHVFSSYLDGNDLYISSAYGSAYGYAFTLDDNDVGYPLILDYVGNSTVEVSNTKGGDFGESSVTGIIFTGGSFTVATMENIDITATTEGYIAAGIVVDYSSSSWIITIDKMTGINIVASSTYGLATGIFLDTQDVFDGTLIGEISDVSIELSSKGNVYGYVLGKEVGVGDDGSTESYVDGGIGFYNSYYADSSNMADNFVYNTISLTVTSTGANGDFTGNAAYGAYFQD